MRICLINNLYGAAARGGAESIVEREVTGLAARGHAVAVVSTVRPSEISGAVCRPDGCDPAVSMSPGFVTPLTFASPNLFAYADLGRHGHAARLLWHVLDMYNRRAARQLGAILDSIRPHIVHTHNLMGVGFLTPRLIRDRGFRHVHTVHDVQLLHPSGLIAPSAAEKSGLARAAYVVLMRRLMGSPETVLFPSEYLMKLHDRSGFFPRSRKLVLRNPAPDALTGSRAPSVGVRFVSVGQLEPHKGIRTLLAAWRLAGLSGAALTLAGGGSLASAVSSGAVPGVKPLGRLPAAEVRSLLAAASWLVFTSEVIENAPSAILEAFAAGTPVIASAVGGVPELVREGKNGFLYPAGDVAALAGLLKKVSAISADDWLHLSDGAFAAARTLDVASHIDGLERAYRG